MKTKNEETLTLDAHQRSHYTIGLYTHVLQRSTKKRFCQQLIVFLSHYDTRNGLRICLTSIWAIYVMIANNVTHCALIERKSFTAVYLHVEQSLGVWSWLSNVWWDFIIMIWNQYFSKYLLRQIAIFRIWTIFAYFYKFST